MNFEALWNECKNNYGIQQKEPEYKELLELLISHNVKTVLELGCYSGGTTRGFLEIADKVVSVDGYKQPQINHLERDFKDKFTFFNMNTHEASTFVAVVNAFGGIPFEGESPKIDFLFIDGDHSAAGCMKDFEIYKGLVKKGGIIAFHDIVDSEDHHRQGCYVDVTWNELKTKYESLEIVRIDRLWAGLGVLFV